MDDGYNYSDPDTDDHYDCWDGYDDDGSTLPDSQYQRPAMAITGRPGVPYVAEHYSYLESLYSSDYRQYLMDLIDVSHLSPAAKRAFLSTIRNFFSQTAFLSYQRDSEIAEIDLDIALNLLTLSCNKIDINLPEYPHLIELIRAHYNRFIISRTLGTERERILQNRTTYESVSKIATDEEQKRAKRGLGIISRIFGGGST
ncbi:MAG: hypothetical protein WC083_05635 [Candidatus Methanomethylophilaceae archaeon]|jgi:hypothetical protein